MQLRWSKPGELFTNLSNSTGQSESVAETKTSSHGSLPINSLKSTYSSIASLSLKPFTGSRCSKSLL